MKKHNKSPRKNQARADKKRIPPRSQSARKKTGQPATTGQKCKPKTKQSRPKAKAKSYVQAQQPAKQPNAPAPDQAGPAAHPQNELMATVERLAKLSPAEYDRERKTEAKRLKIRLSTLDEQVQAKRAAIANAVPTSTAIAPQKVEPWQHPVNGADLLEGLRGTVNRFMVLPPHVAELLALWILHTYAFDCFEFTPYLHVTSPVKECGKSTLAELLHKLCRAATTPGGISPAAMRRVIQKLRPTLLVDEWDTMSEDARREALHVLNTGFWYNGAYTVCVCDNHEPTEFHTFCPKAIFGLADAKLPETTRSRCFQNSLEKKPPGQQVERLTQFFVGTEMQRKCLRWTADNGPQLKKASPEMPAGLSSRQEDIARPLLAIADACGGQWRETVGKSVLHLFNAAQSEDEGENVEVLSGVRQAFDEKKTDRLSTHQICESLNDLTNPDCERFVEYNRGKGITQRQLARLMQTFGIHALNIKFPDGKVLKGYRREDLEHAFLLYLPQGDSIRYSATAAENKGDSPAAQPPLSASGSGLARKRKARKRKR